MCLAILAAINLHSIYSWQLKIFVVILVVILMIVQDLRGDPGGDLAVCSGSSWWSWWWINGLLTTKPHWLFTAFAFVLVLNQHLLYKSILLQGLGDDWTPIYDRISLIVFKCWSWWWSHWFCKILVVMLVVIRRLVHSWISLIFYGTDRPGCPGLGSPLDCAWISSLRATAMIPRANHHLVYRWISLIVLDLQSCWF